MAPAPADLVRQQRQVGQAAGLHSTHRYGRRFTAALSATHAAPTGTLNREAVYDYNFAAATACTGPAVWMDVRNAASCPAVSAYRQSLIDGNPIAPPSPVTDCPPQFGNEDIFGGVYDAPTP